MTLEDIKAGDEVAIETRSGIYLAKVSKVTKTQIVTERGGRYRKGTGEQVGADMWSSVSIKPITKEVLSRIEKEKELIVKRNLLNQIKALKATKLDIVALKKAAKLLGVEP